MCHMSALPYRYRYRAQIFKGQPSRGAFWELAPYWYRTFSPDHIDLVEMKQPTGMSNKSSTESSCAKHLILHHIQLAYTNVYMPPPTNVYICAQRCKNKLSQMWLPGREDKPGRYICASVKILFIRMSFCTSLCQICLSLLHVLLVCCALFPLEFPQQVCPDLSISICLSLSVYLYYMSGWCLSAYLLGKPKIRVHTHTHIRRTYV